MEEPRTPDGASDDDDLEAEVRELFNELDTNGSGVLTLDEFKGWLKREGLWHHVKDEVCFCFFQNSR